ncbi:cellulose binding domain-containing protein [Streptomyces phyllanthi]|uniref:Cellulose-binding protein n=1 Tax=Streptomyces phyllanthi TaxID=1803180 RepID=A0A5N8W8W0_9ACTN|nr:cellulose-binding domain-containing protein [Streptomyces phyllanthi]MPY43917.1 cellulose-binding protein [Streptomyces phyllanthi]
MPDLPKPQDATEAAMLSECWDAVLSYADLCTSGSASATQLATEAFTHGIQEARADEARAGRGAGRRVLRLPRTPFLLTAVRSTAASWEAHGQGHRLDPDLRLWLNSDKAARYTGPPLHRPLALRGLSDMQEPDAALLWLAEVEALPLPMVARRLGLDPASAAEELSEVRALFRDRCHRNHLDTPMDAGCRSYARLLDAVTRSPGAETPEDLSRHLATCVDCAEAAACLRLHGGGLPSALAGGVIGWGGLAYLERRRRASEAGLAPGRADASGTDRGLSPSREPKPRVGRTGMLVGAGLVSVLALAASLMPFGSEGGELAQGEPVRQPVSDPDISLPTVAPQPTDTSGDPSELPRADASRTPGDDSDPEPQGEGSSPARVTHRPVEPGKSEDSSSCRVRYEIVNEWPDGFQATVTVTSTQALDDWRIGWTFQDGQQVTQMWDGSYDQDGSRVTASAADYNRSVAADGTFGVGFLGSWEGDNSTPRNFTLNGDGCTTAG